MAMDYSVHAFGAPVQGEALPAPLLPPTGGEKGIAADADSAAVTGPCVIAVVSSARARFEARAAADAQDVANSPVVLEANQTRYFALGAGSWKLRHTAYA